MARELTWTAWATGLTDQEITAHLARRRIGWYPNDQWLALVREAIHRKIPVTS